MERGKVLVLGGGMGLEQMGGRVSVGGGQEHLVHPKPSGKQRQQKPYRGMKIEHTHYKTCTTKNHYYHKRIDEAVKQLKWYLHVL